jgi:hypothetical protein
MAVVGCLWVPAQASAQSAVGLSGISGRVGVAYQGSGVTTRSGTLLRTGQFTQFEESVDLSLRGWLGHPAFAPFEVSVAPSWQQWPRETRDSTRATSGNNLGLSAEIQFLPRKPFSAFVRAGRFSLSSVAPFGTVSDVRLSRVQAGARFRNAYLPLKLIAQSESRDQEWATLSGSSTGVSQTWRLVELEGRNRKTGLRVARRELIDRANGTDFEQTEGSFDNRFRWGKGSRLATDVRYIDRSGFAARRTFRLNERVHLQHTRAVSSDLGYHYGKVTTGTTRSSYHQPTFGLTVRASRRLRVGLTAVGSFRKFGGGSARSFRLGPRFNLGAPLTRGVSFSVSASVRYGYLDLTDPALGGVPVFGEQHVIDNSRVFVLQNANVDPGSIIVTDRTETLQYQEGLDYRVADQGVLLEVLVLPGGRIAVGDTVLVSYEYDPSGSDASGKTLEVGTSASVRAGPVELYHRRWFADAFDEQGSVALVERYDDMENGVRVAWNVVGVQLSVHGAHRRLESAGSANSSLGVSGNVGWSPLAGVRLGGSGSVTSWSTGSRNVSLGADAHWYPLRRLRIFGYLGYLNYRATVADSERAATFTIGLNWRVGLTTLTAGYTRNSRRDGQDITEDRFSARLSRSF